MKNRCARFGLSGLLVLFSAAFAPLKAATLYVWTNSPAPAAPYTNWSSAAHTIQEAIDACATNDTVLVTNGVYDTGYQTMPGYTLLCRVVITNGVTVRSVNGPAETILLGQGPIGVSPIRCAYLSQDATLDGFTLTNGHTTTSGWYFYDLSGAGAFILNSGTIANCVIAGNRAAYHAGGVMCHGGGRVLNSIVEGNSASNSGGGIYLNQAGLVSNCLVRDNTARWNGGGVEVSYTGLVTRCSLYGNRTQTGDGGGVDLYYGGGISHCLIYSNLAGGVTEYDGGGGVQCFFGGTITNSAIYGNSALTRGGGVKTVFGGEVVNCSIFDNAAGDGGGIYCDYSGSNKNSVIYHNRALNGPNFTTNGSGNYFWANCITPLPGLGGGNITNAPLLAGVRNWHLLTNSPCINAGSNAFAAGIALDLDWESRIVGATVDIGCDEVFPAGLTGSLSVAIRVAATQVVVNIPLTFYSDVSGKVSRTEWRLQTGGGSRGATNTFSETQSWSAPGTYPVVLSAFNNAAYASVTVSVTVLSGFTNYAAQGGVPAAPYTSWATAATSLYEAVQALPPGGVTLVSNGVFEEENEIVFDKPATIRGVNGPGATAIGGRGAHRVFRIAGVDVRLHDLAIVNGDSRAESGGGVLMESDGVLSNCWIVGNVTSNDGAGVYLNGGGTLLGCLIASNRAVAWGGDGGGAYFNLGGAASDCRFERNFAVGYGGGAHFNRGGSADDSLFLSNLSSNGGGGAYCNYGGAMRNGQFADNASYSGGGIYFYNGGCALNARVADNTAQHSGGGLYVYGSSSITCVNATVQGNVAGVRGGGVYASFGGNVLNSIIYYNRAPLGENFFNDWSGYRYNTCCMTPAPAAGGSNIMTNEPLFAGILNPHLMSNSPCIDAGSNVFAAGIAVDVDGEPRTNHAMVDIGCDEFWAAGMTGALSVAILVPYTNAVVNTPLSFQADVQGKANSIVWRVGDVGATNRFTNALSITHTWPVAGTYRVILAAYNGSGSAAATVTVTLVNGFTNYVDLANPTPAAPYTSWATAASGIQEAVNAAAAGGLILITNGYYNPAAEIVMAKPVRLQSVNGPDFVTVNGQGLWRVFNVSASGASLTGLTVTNGFTADNGGGILCGSGVTITNCRIVNCRAANGAGVYFNGGGSLFNSRLRHNRADTAGGGVYCSIGGRVQNCDFYSNVTVSTSSGGGGGAYVDTVGILLDCVLTNNLSNYRGGGAYGYYGGVFSNCLIARNAAKGWTTSVAGGGLYLAYGGVAQGCTISNNLSDEIAGGVCLYYGGLIEDCVVVTNYCDGGGGGVYVNSLGTIRRTRIDRNIARWDSGGGVYFYRGGQADGCVIAENQAPNGWQGGGGVYADRAGVVLTNCQVLGNLGDRGGGISINEYGTVTDTSIRDNRAGWSGGGASLNMGGRITRCSFSNNTAEVGGGAYIFEAGVISNSVFIGNVALDGGGVELVNGGDLLNSYLLGNVATNRGGGAALFSWGENSVVAHCTLVGNTCYGQGGGLWTDTGGTMRNSILYDNRAVFGNNWFNDAATGATYEHCCITPDPGGTGNITVAPQLSGRANPHLLTNSPCVDAGDNAWAFGRDIDQEPRIVGAAADIGCDEVDATNLNGAISAAIYAPATNVIVQTPIAFESDVQGRISGLAWSVDTGAGTIGFTNVPVVSQSWNTPGDYTVTLMAWNDTDYAAATVTVHVTESMTNYVAPGGAHVWPFATWANASTSIAEAVAAAAYGGVVVVSNGVYREAPAVFVDRPLTIRSVNGWEHTTMDGQGIYRCFFLLETNVLIEGFTFSNGMARADVFGGGGAVVLNEGGTVRHCRFVNCNAAQYGGGAVCYYGGSLQNCWFTGNAAMFGGAVLCYYGGEVVNSTIVGNRAYAQGGGVYCEGGGAVRNSILYYNYGAMGANWLNVAGGMTCENVCATPLPPGPGNFTNAPGLAGLLNPHLLTNAACFNAGSNAFAAAIAVDWDFEPRILNGRVEIGCDEFHPPGLTGGLFAAIGATTPNTAPGIALDFWALVAGKAARTTWTVDTGSGSRKETNALFVSQSWAATGAYNIVLSAFNNSGGAAATVTVTVAAGTIRYVSTNGLHVTPFTNWTGAANTITAALAVAAAGDTVLITDGVHVAGAEIVVDKAVRLASVNGPEATIVDGKNTSRVFRLEHPGAVLDGLGITKGNAQYSPGGEGGGVALNGCGLVVNCDIFNNQSPNYAGGALLYGGGVVSNCILRQNRSAEGGGAQIFNGGLVVGSRIIANEVTSRGGGVSIIFGGTVSNCAIQKNISNNEGGGVAFYEGGTCVDSMLATNQATEGGGAYFYMDGSLLNCVVASNFAWSMGGGARTYQGGLIRNCLFYRNTADVQWGFGRGGGIFLRLGGTVESCTVVENYAPAGAGGGIHCNSGGTVLNSIVYSNRAENLAGADQGAFSYCCAEPAPGGTFNFTNNPRFVNCAAYDYRLASNSPCVEQGLNQAWMTPAVDLDRTARIKNPFVDIGAYESAWTNVDTDGDGLLVDIERQRFGTSDLNPDTDGDTQGDWVEAMITGTSPSDGSLYFRGLIGLSAPGRAVLRWPSITNRVYNVETVVGLTTGKWIFVPGWTNRPGVAGFMYFTNLYTDPVRHFRPSVMRTNW